MFYGGVYVLDMYIYSILHGSTIKKKKWKSPAFPPVQFNPLTVAIWLPTLKGNLKLKSYAVLDLVNERLPW